MSALTKFKFSRFHQIVATTLPEALRPTFSGLKLETRPTPQTDLRLIAGLSPEAAQQAVAQVAHDQLLAFSGHVFLIYPKANSRHFTGIPRDAMLQALGLNQATGELGHTGLKFMQMLSLDADFTVLDLKWAKAASTAARIADYDAQVPTLSTRLAKQNPKVGRQWQTLTPAMQKQWARYIYSPKRIGTQKMHFEQLIVVLAAGLRTLEDYQGAR